MTAAGAGMHPGWTREWLLRLMWLAEGDAAYLASLRRPWRRPVPPVLTDEEVAAAAAAIAEPWSGISSWRAARRAAGEAAVR